MPSFHDPLVLARALHFAATAQLSGVILFRAFVAWPEGARRGLARLAFVMAALAAGSGVLWIWAIAQAAGPASFAAVVTQTRFGALSMARGLALCALVAALPRLVRPPAGPADAMLAALAAAFAASLALAGHAGVTDAAHAIADALHLLAAAAWPGSLVPLALCLRGPDAAAVARRFSTLGIASVSALVLTGAINSWYLGGGLPGLLGTDWGRLLGLKLVLFAAMLGLAAVNRLWLTPRLGAAGARESLRRNALVEAAAGLAIVAIVALLGATPPGAHEQPVWPLAWRFDPDAFLAEPEIAAAAWRCLLLSTGGLVFAAVAVAWRRARVGAGALAAIAFGLAARDAPAFAIPASPTTFQTSGAPYSARTIAAGAKAFRDNCVVCHGARGRGDGPAAAGLATKPADLTQDHLFAHYDGDLFGWISNGLGAMPAFAVALDEETRWSLVDFLRANADGARMETLGGRVAGAAFPLPEFALACPAGKAATSVDLTGEALHVVVPGPDLESRLRQLSYLATETRTIVAGAAPAGEWRPCEASDPDLLAALSVYRGGPPEDLAGAEFLVDSSGRLRSAWRAGMATDWRDPLSFRRAVAEMKVPRDLSRALSAVNAAPGARVEYDNFGHRH